MTEIRDTRAYDADAVAGLLAELGYPADRSRVGARLAGFDADPASRVLVAEEDGEVVGVASLTVMPLLHEDGAWVRISALVVGDGSRRRGVGRALVEAAETEARAGGCRYAEVTSGERPDRHAAHGFYEALGYEQVSRRFLKAL